MSGTPERIVSGAQALDEAQLNAVKTRVSKVAEVLETSATQLRNDLGDIMGIQWQGEFANGARVPIDGLTNSALDLAGALRQVVDKADEAEAGFGRTRQDIGSEATALQILGQVSAQDQGPGAISLRAELDAEREAAEEQARAIMNTVYSPAVMRANIDELDFPNAYRVVSTSALGGPNGVDMANIWNDEGVIRPAVAGTPSAAAIATASETSVGGSGGTLSGSGGASAGLGATAEPTDAATEQALLVARGGVADGAGLGAGPSAAGTAGTSGNGGGGGVNAGTAAPGAGAPMMTTANARDSGATGTAGSGGRGSTRGAERGLGSGAGQSGGGAAASRMGGAARPGMPAGGAPGSGAASGRVGGMPMGMMGAAGAGQGSRSAGHRPASYLVNATNTSEILGKPVKVSPARIGARPQVEPTVDEGMASATKPESKNGSSAASPAVTPAQALVNKLRGR